MSTGASRLPPSRLRGHAKFCTVSPSAGVSKPLRHIRMSRHYRRYRNIFSNYLIYQQISLPKSLSIRGGWLMLASSKGTLSLSLAVKTGIKNNSVNLLPSVQNQRPASCSHQRAQPSPRRLINRALTALLAGLQLGSQYLAKRAGAEP